MSDNIYAGYEESGHEAARVSGVLKIKKENNVDKQKRSNKRGPDKSDEISEISHSETNYNKASFFYKNNSFDSAEKLLLENLELGAADARTFDMLISIYNKTDNYTKLINILDTAAKRCSSRKKEYRQLKKSFILQQILKDLNSV